VGQNLFFHLNERIEIVNVYNRSKTNENSKILTNKLVTKFEDLSNDVDLNIISSTDSSIELIIQYLPKSVPIVHTSGSISLEVLNSFNTSGVFYPLQTFSKDRVIDMGTIPFLLETSSDSFLKMLTQFVKVNFSNNIHQFNSSDREKIHLAAVFINNFTTLMARESESILNQNNIDSSILKPLLVETVNKLVDSKNINTIQTGPAQREDMGVISKHLEGIDDLNQKEIYKILSNRIIELKSNS
jgi:predicted short-subunit dehydrogenase-like oxidoreductase (DUF2520 family)